MSQNIARKLLRVAILGAPNAGKSTLLNKLIETDICAVSKKVHTTRKNLTGCLTRGNTQIEFIDSPGLVTRDHLIKHKLESTLYEDPEKACIKCDLIAVLVDASNPREQRKLNRGILNLLKLNQQEKKSFLILNKVDLVKEKRKLIDIGVRLTQGCIEGKLTLAIRDIKRLHWDKIHELNLTAHVPKRSGKGEFSKKTDIDPLPSTKRKSYVTILDTKGNGDIENSNIQEVIDPDSIGYKYFSEVHSISALNSDGLDKLRDSLIEYALPVESWPHGPLYVSNSKTEDIVDSIVRGKVLDHVDREVPYLVKFRYLLIDYDELGSLNVNLKIECPEKYMIPKVLGKFGVNIGRIVDESRDLIAKNLGCDVKLNIEVGSR